MELALSPVYSAWDKKRLKDFYLEEVVNMDVSTVYIGEVVCQKRDMLSKDDYQEIIAALKGAGKTVYLSTLALITNQDELNQSKRHVNLFEGVEVNSFGMLNLLIKDESLKDKKIIIGPFMNIYNSVAADYLKKFNPARIVTPYEVPFDTIKDIAKKSDVPLEVYSWGQLSTALSWRCYTARTFDLTREKCAKKCFEYPDGILLETLEKEPLYVANGIQVLSSKMHCIVEQIDMLKEINLACLRITPSHENTADVVKIFSGVLDGSIDKKEAVNSLNAYAPYGLSNGWFLGKPGWEYIAA
jgi:collagenase-like PrtC family protease